MSEPLPKQPALLLVINCGSSSIKYQLIDVQHQRWFLKGLLENIGAQAQHRVTYNQQLSMGQDSAVPIMLSADGQATPSTVVTSHPECRDASAALRTIAETLKAQSSVFNSIVHRVVHGGQGFNQPLRITPAIVGELKSLSPLAPLHNPANILGIETCAELFPQLPQFAVFDTAFHATLPAHAYRYGVPESWHALGVRRYGFHGTSHQFVARQAAHWLNKPLADTHLITLHLGNGASVTAIERGCSIDTSMGFTPLEGLLMGTRCGDLDAGIPAYIARQTQMSPAELEHQLWHDCGLKGIAGTNDMRELLKRADAGNAQARLAIDMYCYRGKKYIGAYLAALPHVDAIVFTGGIGENAAPIRAKMLDGLQHLGLELDTARNLQGGVTCARISSDTSRLPLLVIATNEELEMANQVAPLLAAH